jgi:hypothetical protein
MMVIHNKGEHKAFLNGRQTGLRSSHDMVEQLVQQLQAARKELAEARAAHSLMMCQVRAHFDAEVAQVRKEMELMVAELKGLDAFAKLTRGAEDRLN